MDQPHNLAAPDPSGENSYSGSGALSECMTTERTEAMISSNREAMLERELEKQRIREEILMDIVRRREIEAKVRRELAMEEMALRRGENSLLSRSTVVDYGITETRHPEPNIQRDQQNRASLSSGGVGVGAGFTRQMLEPRLASQEKPMGINLRDMLLSPAEPEADNVHKAVKTHELNKANHQDMVKPYSPLVGIKRKSEYDFVKSESSSKNNTALTCTLCNITSTGKKCHQMHLQGRKHRNKALMDLESTKAPVEPSVAMMRVVGRSSTREKGSEKDFERKRKLDKLKRRFAFICSDCVIGCQSEDILMKHCSGKKHAKHLAASKFWETGASTTLDNKKLKPEELKSTEQMVHGAGEVGMAEGIGEAAWQRALLKLADTIPAPDFKNNQNQLMSENQESTTNVKAVPNILVYTRNKRGVSGTKMADGAGEVDAGVCTGEVSKVEQDG